MRIPLALFALLLTPATPVLAATVQLDCRAILDARPVSVLGNGSIVAWTKGIDGGGSADGFATVSAARTQGDPTAHALPDNGKFAATVDHPFVQLPYGNARATQPQARALSGECQFELSLPQKALGDVFLFFTSAEGASQLSAVLHYADGTSERHSVEMPDYYRTPQPTDKDLFALASDLAKWNAAGKLAEGDHHYIYGWKIRPEKQRSVKSITLHKTAASYAVFWGATIETHD